MKIVSRLVASVALLGLPLSAHGQQFTDIGQQLDGQIRARGAPGDRTTPLRVQSTYQLQVPFDRAASADDQKAALASSHATLYELLAHECNQLQAVFKMECRIASVTVGNFAQACANCTTMPVNASGTFELYAGPATKAEPPKP